MKKVITPSTPEVAAYYCDGCKQLVCTMPITEQQVINREFCLQMAGDFKHAAFNLAFCEECGLKIVLLIEKEFNTKIDSNIFDDRDLTVDMSE